MTIAEKQAPANFRRSVKRNELGKNKDSYTFWIPYQPGNAQALPAQLPDGPKNYSTYRANYGRYPNSRDQVLVSTVYYESMWAGVVGMQASKFSIAGWELSGAKPRVQTRIQDLLLNASVGIVSGWVPFASAHMNAFANLGKAFVEAERFTASKNSRVKALHHLDPTRCWMTTDPEIPVVYIDANNREHHLRAHQVMIFQDTPDPTESMFNSPSSAAARAYQDIVTLASIKLYIYEKASGRRPLAMNFIQGISEKTLRDATETAQDEADRKGVAAYMGAAMTAIMGDVPINVITVPLAEIPDGVNVEQIRQDSHLVYANAVGENPAVIDPRLIGNRQLGAGTQAIVLEQETKYGGIVNSLKQQWVHSMNWLISESKIQFSFSFSDIQDERARAEVAKIRSETRNSQIEMGEITPDEARNLAVDQGDLPPEFLDTDITSTTVLRDDEQPVDSDTVGEANESNDGFFEIEEKQFDNPQNLQKMIDEELANARSLFSKIKAD